MKSKINSNEAIRLNATAYELFHDFLDLLDENNFTSQQSDVRNAIQREFDNLDFLLRLMRKSHNKALKLHPKLPSGTFTGLNKDYVGQTVVIAEAFYCAAHRLKVLFKKGPFKEFKNLELLPLTLIRNKVVEHTSVDRNASSWTNNGPQLFVGGEIVSEHPLIKDDGFYPNVFNFYTELHSVLRMQLKQKIEAK